jgi:HTH-type transcriptional regulator/antitoxin HigA
MKQNKDISPSPKKPGDEIKELMEQKGWQQQELANLLNLSLKHVNEILNGKKNISFDLAIMLEKIFDKEAYYWIKLDTEYRIASLQ